MHDIQAPNKFAIKDEQKTSFGAQDDSFEVIVSGAGFEQGVRARISSSVIKELEDSYDVVSSGLAQKIYYHKCDLELLNGMNYQVYTPKMLVA